MKLGFTSFFVKAAVHALKKYPVVNASVDGTDIVYHGYYDIGIAVGSREVRKNWPLDRYIALAQSMTATGLTPAFLIGPIAEFWIIPLMESDRGQRDWGWLVGDGLGRGIALVFVFSGLVMVVAALLAFTTKSYRTLSKQYAIAPETPAEEPAPL